MMSYEFQHVEEMVRLVKAVENLSYSGGTDFTEEIREEAKLIVQELKTLNGVLLQIEQTLGNIK